MRTRSCLVAVTVSIAVIAMPLRATTTTGTSGNAIASVVTTAALADFEQETPSWALTTSGEQTELTSMVLNAGHLATEVPEGTIFLEGAGALPPDQARSEARVPEPATLIFVGTGLIGISRFARRKLPEWKFRTVAAQIQEAATQEA